MRRLPFSYPVACFAGILTAVLAIGVAPVSAAHLGRNGPIIFSYGYDELWSVRSDGTGLELLTAVPGPPGIESAVWSPSVSANGRKIVVALREYNRPTPCDPNAINAGSYLCTAYVLMNIDGSHQRLVYASEDALPDVSIAPNGERIVFTKVSGESREQLFTIRTNGTQLRLLTPQTFQATDFGGTWSPDGKDVFFTSSRDGALTGHSWSLFRVNVRTRKVSRVLPTSNTDDFAIDWSPDGKELSFDRYAYPSFAIYTVGADGSGEQELIGGGELGGGWWSPDGTKMLFSRDDGPLDRGLWVMDASGSHRHHIVSGIVRGGAWAARSSGQ
jgi:Tol biopolymer transport system component